MPYIFLLYMISIYVCNYMCVYELVECCTKGYLYSDVIDELYNQRDRERERTERKSIEGGIGAPQFEDIVR
ncbi:hypothetical protein Syun_010035 [Stephania yunnanensis]|uniref:Uncharacterized protein n=1 Tax=Stephania yunnanensis TaxID=152371 RepID=A0AAP0KFQ2_9MAGN